MNIGEEIFNYDTNLLKKAKSITNLEYISDYNSVIEDALIYLKSIGIEPTVQDLNNHKYSSLGKEAKKYLIAYFYLAFNRMDKQHTDSFVAIKHICSGLNIKQSEFENTIRSYKYKGTLQCPVCNENITVKIKGFRTKFSVNEYYTEKRKQNSKKIIECNGCGHLISNYIESSCSCSICKEIISKTELFFREIKKNIEAIIPKYLGKDTELPSDERQEWYAKNLSSDLNGSERKAISFNPKNFEELKEIFKDNTEIYYLKESFIQKKIAFLVRKMKSKEDIINGIMKDFYFNYSTTSGGGYNNFLELDLTKLMVDYIRVDNERDSFCIGFDPNKIEVDAGVYEDTGTKIKVKSIELSGFPHLSDDNFYDTKIELNPYFFNQMKIKERHISNVQFVKNIFKSPYEKNQYEFLRVKYPENIIIPNIRLLDFVDTQMLGDFFNKNDLKYISWCICDFVLFSLDGIPLHVIELQRGKHHNTKEYIKKDNLKKKAIEYAGLSYEEIF